MKATTNGGPKHSDNPTCSASQMNQPEVRPHRSLRQTLLAKVPSYATHSPLKKFGVLFVGPLVFGALASVALSQSIYAYLAWTLIGILGGLMAGFEHPTRFGAFVRGAWGAMMYAIGFLGVTKLLHLKHVVPLAQSAPIFAIASLVIGASICWTGAHLRAGALQSSGSSAA